MQLEAINDRVLIKPKPKEEKTSGGIIIPDTVDQSNVFGTVVSVGPKCTEVKVGNEVIYEVGAFGVIETPEGLLHSGKESDVVAVIA